MLFIGQLAPEEVITLEEMHKNHPRHLTRKRAHSLLLSHQGYSVPMICSINDVCRQTVSTLFHKWETQGLCGLVDRPGRGRPCILTEEQSVTVIKQIEKSPKSLKQVIADLAKEFNIKINVYLLRRLCKKTGLVWKRARRSLRSKRDQEKFDAATLELKELIQQFKDGKIDLRYFDEAGFTLVPSIPYAWQAPNTTIEIPCSKSKRLNVLGFLNRDCKFDSFVFEGSITSAIVVGCFDWFANQIEKTTVVVIDNASIHTSDEFTDAIEEWEKKGLIIYPLPKYSPELNIIEILWRRIKYDWLPFEAYESYAALKKELFDVLASIGESRSIVFS
jgi:transposase